MIQHEEQYLAYIQAQGGGKRDTSINVLPRPGISSGPFISRQQ
jgi:hypothetical protein